MTEAQKKVIETNKQARKPMKAKKDKERHQESSSKNLS